MFPHDSTRPKESADRGAQGEAPKSDALEKEARIQMNWSLAVVRCNWKILEVPSCNFLFGFPKHPKRNPSPRGEAQKKECPCKMESSPLNIQRSLLGNVVVLPGILRRNLLCAESLMFLDLVHGGLSK